MANYTSFAPSQVATRPFDPSSAMDVGLQDIMAREAQKLDLQSMMTGNQQKEAELARYQAQSPNEIALSNLRGGVARATDPTRIAQGDMAEADKKRLEADKVRRMLDSDVQAGLAKNAAEAAANRHKKYSEELGLLNQVMQVMGASGAPGSPQSQGIWQSLRSQLPPEIGQGLPEAWSPDTAKAIQRVLVESPAHLQELAKVQAENKGRTDVAKIHAGASVRSAEISANAPSKNKESEQQHFVKLMQAVTSGKATPEEEMEASMYLQKQIGMMPQVQQEAKMVEMATFMQGGDPMKARQNLNELQATIWDRYAPPALKGKNPFRSGPAAPQPGPAPLPGSGTNVGIPGVVRK